MPADDASVTEMVAYLSAVEGLLPEQIQKALDVSAPTVWRHLKAAREGGESNLEPPLLKEVAPVLDVSERDRERIREAVQRRRAPANEFDGLLDRLKAANPCLAENSTHPLKAVWVLPSSFKNDPGHDTRAWDRAAWGFGRAAAGPVAELLRPARSVGIAWGRTLYSVVHHIAGLKLKRREAGGRATVFPVNGEVFADVPGEDMSDVFPDQTRLSPSFLAAQLATALNGTPHGTPTLTSVSAIIPRKYFRRKPGGRVEADVIKEFIGEVADYSRIFGKQPAGVPKTVKRSRHTHPPAPALVDQADSLLLAVGSSSFPQRFWSRAIMEYLETSADELRETTYGDLGAVLLLRDLSGQKQRLHTLRSIEQCFTGLRLEHVHRCALGAQPVESAAPGVIALGVGRSRRRAMIECIRRGLVNHLVIDEHLARALNDSPDATEEVGE